MPKKFLTDDSEVLLGEQTPDWEKASEILSHKILYKQSKFLAHEI